MARWWKRWTVLAAGLASVLGCLAPALAQGPGYPPQMPPGGSPPSQNQPTEPLGSPTGGEFPRIGSAAAAEPKGPPPHPLSLDDHGTPNGFCDEESYPQPQPYILKLKGEYMLWHVGMPRLSTVLATTSNNNGNGAIGDPGTSSLLGPGSFDYRESRGGRVTAGIAPGYIPPVEISGFWLNMPTLPVFGASSDGSQNSAVLARPFQAPNLASLNGLGQQTSLIAGFPGSRAGDIRAAADMSLWGIESNLFINLGFSDAASLDFILGYRYTDFRESLNIANSVQSVDNTNISFNAVNAQGFPAGYSTIASDSFQTRNQFNGATLGLRPALYVGQFTTSVDLKLALGATHQSLNINGDSALLSPDGSVQHVPGGLLAVASNSGTVSRDVFSVIPEINVNVGFNITRHFKFFATYNIFYWSNVIRPGDQLNNRVDSRQVPTDPTFNPNVKATNPGRPFVASHDFWGQGLSLGLEIGF